ncbi:MAG: protein kinase [Planctomycetota bacterium]
MGERIGPYEVRGELGVGGMGTVLRALDPTLGREVALKVLRSSANVDRQKAHARFLQEAQALARIRHPNVVTVYGAGLHAGDPYLALELVEGPSLGARLERERILAPAEARALMAKLARAVAHVHARGILHRDIKPDNVLLRGGEPLLTDFGLAREVDDELQLTQTGVFLGTPGFAPPEQVRGEVHDLTPAADVYGLGATLYALLTGVPPFQGSTLAEVLMATDQSAPLAPRELEPSVPPELEELCLRCLRKDPRERFPSAAALADALEARPAIAAAPAADGGVAPAPGGDALATGAGAGAPGAALPATWKRVGAGLALAGAFALGLLLRPASRDATPAPADTEASPAAVAASPPRAVPSAVLEEPAEVWGAPRLFAGEELELVEGFESVLRHDQRQATEQLAAVSRREPQGALALYLGGRLQLRRRQVRAAGELIDASLRARETAWGHYVRSLIATALKRPDVALRAARRALELKRDPRFATRVTQTERDAGRYAAARDAGVVAVELHRGRGDSERVARLLLAGVLHDLDRLDDARAEVARALALRDEPTGRLLEVQVARARGDLPAARALLDAALARFPDDQPLQLAHLRLLVVAGETAAAQRLLASVIPSPGQRGFDVEAAWVSFLAGDPQGARRRLAEVPYEPLGEDTQLRFAALERVLDRAATAHLEELARHPAPRVARVARALLDG